MRTEGAGNVNLNVELDNTLQSGNTHAGVEKGNGGNLTIGSESGSGQLVAVGGDGGAGIGSEDRLASGNYNVGNITITGGDIFATGDGGGAGIGGGWYCGASDITITGGNVTAVGDEDNPNRIGGAGIGGGGSAEFKRRRRQQSQNHRRTCHWWWAAISLRVSAAALAPTATTSPFPTPK